MNPFVHRFVIRARMPRRDVRTTGNGRRLVDEEGGGVNLLFTVFLLLGNPFRTKKPSLETDRGRNHQQQRTSAIRQIRARYASATLDFKIAEHNYTINNGTLRFLRKLVKI